MKSYLLLVGDEQGLVGGDEYLQRDFSEMRSRLVAYSGPTGVKALPDPKFIEEVILRRSALHLSAIRLSKMAGFSGGYVAMLERGVRHPSDEAKEQIREALNFLERLHK